MPARCARAAAAEQGARARGQQQGDQDTQCAQEQAAADQRAYSGAVEQAAGQHADGQGAGRERCHDQARVQGAQVQDELQALGEEQFDAGGGGHRQCGGDHSGEQAPVAEQGDVDQRVGSSALTASPGFVTKMRQNRSPRQ
jgi:hypothetical protein